MRETPIDESSNFYTLYPNKESNKVTSNIAWRGYFHNLARFSALSGFHAERWESRHCVLQTKVRVPFWGGNVMEQSWRFEHWNNNEREAIAHDWILL